MVKTITAQEFVSLLKEDSALKKEMETLTTQWKIRLVETAAKAGFELDLGSDEIQLISDEEIDQVAGGFRVRILDGYFGDGHYDDGYFGDYTTRNLFF